MTVAVKGKTKAQKMAEKTATKAIKATEKMHNDVTASLEQLQHRNVKTSTPKVVAGMKKAPIKAKSQPKKK